MGSELHLHKLTALDTLWRGCCDPNQEFPTLIVGEFGGFQVLYGHILAVATRAGEGVVAGDTRLARDIRNSDHGIHGNNGV